MSLGVLISEGVKYSLLMELGPEDVPLLERCPLSLSHRYEWVFEQEKDNFAEYKGHVRCGRELFITFQFTADWRYHYTHK